MAVPETERWPHTPEGRLVSEGPFGGLSSTPQPHLCRHSASVWSYWESPRWEATLMQKSLNWLSSRSA